MDDSERTLLALFKTDSENPSGPPTPKIGLMELSSQSCIQFENSFVEIDLPL